MSIIEEKQATQLADQRKQHLQAFTGRWMTLIIRNMPNTQAGKDTATATRSGPASPAKKAI